MKTKILYKSGLILIILAWVVFFITYPIVSVLFLILMPLKLKLGVRYSTWFNNLIRHWDIKIKNWYVKKVFDILTFEDKQIHFDGEPLTSGNQ